MLGLPIGREHIRLKIVSDPLNWKKEQLVILRSRVIINRNLRSLIEEITILLKTKIVQIRNRIYGSGPDYLSIGGY